MASDQQRAEPAPNAIGWGGVYVSGSGWPPPTAPLYHARALEQIMDGHFRNFGATLGAEPSPTGHRDPVAVFRADGIVEGWMPRVEARMSDSLNDAAGIRIRTDMPDGTPGDWVELPLAEVIAVAAPPRPPSEVRVARRRHPVEFDAGPYRVTGTAHLPLGADPQRYLAMGPRRWMPLTDCTVEAAGNAWTVEVVIVNMTHALGQSGVFQPPRFG